MVDLDDIEHRCREAKSRGEDPPPLWPHEQLAIVAELRAARAFIAKMRELNDYICGPGDELGAGNVIDAELYAYDAATR